MLKRATTSIRGRLAPSSAVAPGPLPQLVDLLRRLRLGQRVGQRLAGVAGQRLEVRLLPVGRRLVTGPPGGRVGDVGVGLAGRLIAHAVRLPASFAPDTPGYPRGMSDIEI